MDGKYVVTADSKAWVKELEEKLRKEPQSAPKNYTDTKLRYQKDQDGKINKEMGENFLDLGIEDSEGNTIGTIGVSNFEEGKHEATGFSYSRGEYFNESLIKLNLEEEEHPDMHYKERLKKFKKYEQQLSEIQINKEDALSQAEIPKRLFPFFPRGIIQSRQPPMIKAGIYFIICAKAAGFQAL